MASVSRVSKYKELRESIKEGAGISRESAVEVQSELVEDDTFLSFVNKGSTNDDAKKEEKTPTFEDTITEAKTFEQLSKESSEEIDKALKSAKSNVGKEEHYNTRMDILNKIRNPEKEVIKIDKMENMDTEQFAKGYFIKEPVEEETVIEPAEVDLEREKKKKMTLMERLASMSPKEDAEKVEKVLQQEQVVIKTEPEVEPEPMPVAKPKEEPVVTQEEPMQAKREVIEPVSSTEDTIEIKINPEKGQKDEKIVTILNYAIIALVVVFVVICAMIIYQIFF